MISLVKPVAFIIGLPFALESLCCLLLGMVKILLDLLDPPIGLKIANTFLVFIYKRAEIGAWPFRVSCEIML
jgi:hypothetical protein